MRDRFYLRLARPAQFSIDKGMRVHERRPWMFANRMGISWWVMIDILRRSQQIAGDRGMRPATRIGMSTLFYIDRNHRLSLN